MGVLAVPAVLASENLCCVRRGGLASFVERELRMGESVLCYGCVWGWDVVYLSASSCTA